MIKTILQWLLVGSVALAANPEPSNTFTFGNGSSGNKVLKFNRNVGGLNPLIQWTESANTLQFSNDGLNFSDIGSGSGSGGSGFNVLTNPGFESGITQGWTNTGGAFLPVSAGSNLLFGKGSATFQTFGSGQNVTSTQYTIPNGLIGTNCGATMIYKGGDANLTYQVIDGSLNVLTSQVLVASTFPRKVSLSFPCPLSGTLAVKLVGSSSSALIAIDQMSLGSNELISIGQASFIGEAHIDNPNCAWANAGSGLVPMAPDADCGTPVVDDNPGPGTFDTVTLTHLPKFTLQNLPAGRYVVIIDGTAGTGGSNASMAISDGTTISGKVGFDTTTHNDLSMVGNFNYTSVGNRTFEVVGGVIGFSTTLYGDSGVSPGWFLKIKVYRFPTIQEVALKPDQVANVWSGFHGPACGFAQTSTSMADFGFDTCTLTERTNRNFGTVVTYDTGVPGQNLPGITFTPSRPGTYYVCAQSSFSQTVTGSNQFFELDDTAGTPNVISLAANSWHDDASSDYIKVCGLYKVSDTAPKTVRVRSKVSSGSMSMGGIAGVEWTIFQVDYTSPAPVLVNSVVSTSNGVEKISRLNFGGPGTATSSSSCTVDPCTLYSNSGDVTVVNRTATGSYIIHFSGGTFSDVPVCSCTAATGGNGMCNIEASPGPTSTAVAVRLTQSSSGSVIDANAMVLCVGPH